MSYADVRTYVRTMEIIVLDTEYINLNLLASRIYFIATIISLTSGSGDAIARTGDTS